MAGNIEALNILKKQGLKGFKVVFSSPDARGGDSVGILMDRRYSSYKNEVHLIERARALLCEGCNLGGVGCLECSKIGAKTGEGGKVAELTSPQFRSVENWKEVAERLPCQPIVKSESNC